MARAKLPRKQQGSAEAYHESYGSKNTEASWPHLCTCCMQQTAAQLHRELSKASCPSRPSVCGEPPRQPGPSRTGELPRRARTSSASSNLHGKSRPSPAAHPSGRAATSRDLRGKPRPPPAAQPSGRATTSGTSGNLQATTSAHKAAEPKLNLRGEPLEAPLQAEPPLGKHRSL